jgi:lipopolysaccharide/colanic/teichoic acid biosynthesis glycosyltransferase
MSGLLRVQSMSGQVRTETGINGIGTRDTTSSESRETSGARSGFYIRFGKRIFDTLGAVGALVIVGPFLFLCAVALRLESRGPVFYRQWRVGQYGKPFRLIKLRTMVDGADKQGPKITASGDARITRVGKVLRKTKVDELPQLLNVLRNEMSLVGPRPELPEYTMKYSLDEKKVLDVKPGITGPASLAYINEERLLASRTDRESFYVNTIMRRKLQVDLAYCRRLSFLEDLKTILLTAGALFIRGDFRTKDVKTTSPRQRG